MASEKEIRAITQDLIEQAKKDKDKKTWNSLFSHKPASPLPAFYNRRQVLLSLARTLDTEKDKELARYVVEEEIKLYEDAKDLPQMDNVKTFSAPLQIACFVLSRFHDVSHVWLIWRAIKAAKEISQPLKPEYLYLGGYSPTTSMKDTIAYVNQNKETNKREMKEEIQKQIEYDTKAGATQESVDTFWQDIKHKGWKTELMVDRPSFPDEDVTQLLKDPSSFLEEMVQHPEKWESTLSYRHTMKDMKDANVLKRLLLMIELTNHVENIKKYEELIEYVFEQDCLQHTYGSYYGNSINGSMHVAAYLMCNLRKIENVFKIWRSKNTNGDACFVQHADYLYMVGYTQDSKTSINDTIDFVNKCDPNIYPEKDSLLSRIAYDGRIGWRTQEYLTTFWNKRTKKGFWDFHRLVDGGWG